MKAKYFYLTGLILMVFTACTKLPVMKPDPSLLAGGTSKTATLNLTLQKADYQKLASTDYPYKTLTIDDDADAQKYIPTILNSEYPNVADGSTAAVTYDKSALYFKPNADSLYTDVYYKLTPSDYGNPYGDLSITQALQWVKDHYTDPKNNQLVLLDFTVYPAMTPAPPYSYLYYNGAWQMIYTLQPSQYAAIGLGKYNQLTTANDPNLYSTLGAFLSADITIMDTVKKGDVEFVSFNYYNAKAYQRVVPLVYNGTNWTAPQTSTGTVNFIKQNGSWTFVKPLPVISLTLSDTDITLIANSNAGSAAARSNLAQYKDFDSAWSVQDLDAAMIVVLTADVTSPALNTIYQVTYPKYSGSAPNPLSFQWDGTKWIAKQ